VTRYLQADTSNDCNNRCFPSSIHRQLYLHTFDLCWINASLTNQKITRLNSISFHKPSWRVLLGAVCVCIPVAPALRALVLNLLLLVEINLRFQILHNYLMLLYLEVADYSVDFCFYQEVLCLGNLKFYFLVFLFEEFVEVFIVQAENQK
jgi:hypothetical protein